VGPARDQPTYRRRPARRDAPNGPSRKIRKKRIAVVEVTGTTVRISTVVPAMSVLGPSVNRSGSISILERFPHSVVCSWCRRHGGSATIARRGEQGSPDPGSTYRILLEQIPAIVYIWAVADGLEHMAEEYVSPQIEEVLGFTSDDWLENPRLWIDRLHPEDREEVLDETTRSVQAGEPFILEYRMLARDGRVVWLHDVASVLTRDDTGKATRYHGVQLDITARKEAEHAQRRSFEQLRLVDRQRRELLVRVATSEEEARRRIADGIHDHTLQDLFAVLKRLEIMTLEHPALGDLEDLAIVRSEISQSIDHLRHLTFELHPRILEADGLEAGLRFLLDWTSSKPGAPSHRLEYGLSSEPATPVSSIVYRITQEALTNARKHSGASQVSVSLEDGEGGVLVRIEDDGSGFPSETVVRLSQQHVGLLSMQERAEAAGGWCQVESTPGTGTHVLCWLPHPGSMGDDEPEVDRQPSPRTTTVTSSGGETSREPRERSRNHLSPRELEVAELLAIGHTNAEVASILHLSVRTIEHHRSNLFQKLGVRSRAGLVRVLRERS
jgi:PAS domain S-box-containing protein